MPQLPDQTVFSQGSYTYQDQSVNPAAFGATVGPALQGAANELSDIAIKRQEIWNEKTNNDALNGLMNEQSQMLTKYKSLQGDDAVNSLDNYRKQLNDSVSKYRANLNPAAARQYDQTASRVLRFNMDGVDSHWDQQFKTATLTSNASSISLQKQRAANAGSPQEFQDALGQITDLSKRHADLVGIHGDAQTEFTNAHLGEAYALAIQKAEGDQNVGKAQGLLAAGKDYLGANYKPLANSIDQLNADQNSLATARDLYKASGGNIRTLNDSIWAIKDKKLQGETWRYAHEMYAEDQTARLQQKMQAQADVAQRVADQTAELAAGVKPSAPLNTSDMVNAGLNPKQIQHYNNTLTSAANYGSAVAQSAFTTPEEDVQLQEANKPTAAKEGFALQQEMYKSLGQVIQNKYQALKADPAGYVLQQAPDVQKAFSDAFKNPALLPQAMSQLTAYYDKLGLPQSQRSLLPAKVAAQLGETIAGLSPQQRTLYLQDFSKKVGPAYIGPTAAQLAKWNPMLGLQAAHADTVDASGQNVGAMLATGSDLLYGRSDAEGKVLAKPSFKLETKDENEFKAAFENRFGASYSGRSDAKELDQAGVLAVYAAKGNLKSTSTFKQSLFDEAAQSYFGNAPVKIGASSVFAPYGVDTGQFRQHLNDNVENIGKAYGWDDSQIRRAQNHGFFVQVGSDMFTINAPDTNGALRPVQDPHGRPLIFTSGVGSNTVKPDNAPKSPLLNGP